MKFKKLLSNLLILVIIITFVTPLPIFSEQPSEEFVLNIAPQPTRAWTFMLYLCGDTRDDVVSESLDNSNIWPSRYMSSTVNSLVNTDLEAGSEANLNVIALFDKPYSATYPQGHAELLKIEPNNLTLLANYGPKNMGDPSSLSNFIDYCKNNFPADNYALTLSDHGRGYAGLCYDYHAPHPYWEYALGDCLSVEELGLALSSSGGVDVLFLDTCLGGSFELLWQLVGDVHYVVAGESSQPGKGLFHPRDILYNLSREISMNPLYLAFEGFRSAKNPTYYPKYEEVYPFIWNSIAVYDLSQFDDPPDLGGLSLMDAFNEFTFYLFDEVTYNITNAREVFEVIGNKLYYPPTFFESNSLMVDLEDFVTTVLEHSDEMYNKIELENYGTQLLDQLVPSYPYTGNPIIEYFTIETYQDDNTTGFSICFPNSLDMYQEYLYPNFYHNMDVSLNSYWDSFIFSLFPPNNVMFKMPNLEYYEIYLDQIDPTVHLHVFFDRGPFEEPLHIGYTGPDTANVGMNIEIGVEGASFQDTMIFGNTKIQIPVASIPALTKDSVKHFQVVINASTAASTVLDVNLTVRHIDATGILWQDTKISDIQIGQIISTNISTNDEWTDWEELSPPITTSKFFGFEITAAIISTVFTFTLLVIFIKRKKQQNK